MLYMVVAKSLDKLRSIALSIAKGLYHGDEDALSHRPDVLAGE
jgi:hypothetical protein